MTYQKPEDGTRESGDAPDLSVVQRWFAAVITHPDGVEAGAGSEAAQQMVPLSRGELERMVLGSETLTVRERLSIYANAYYTRLIECLGASFPVLKQTLGEAAFNGFAFGYLQAYPSRTYTLNRLGDRFAEYLEQTRPKTDADRGSPGFGWPEFLIDLATLEWTIAEVYDGPGSEWGASLAAEDLGRVAPEHWPDLRLQTSPSLRLLHLRFPLNRYYTAARRAGDQTSVPIPEPEESFIAVTRRDFIVRRQDLTRPQYALLLALQNGAPVGQAIAQAAAESSLDDDAFAAQLKQWFHNWAQLQVFTRIASPA